MRIEESREGGPEPVSGSEEDRVVSRRVDNPTAATADDERAYAAADPAPDPQPEPGPDSTDRTGGRDGGTTTDTTSTTLQAEDDLRSESDEPTRSE